MSVSYSSHASSQNAKIIRCIIPNTVLWIHIFMSFFRWSRFEEMIQLQNIVVIFEHSTQQVVLLVDTKIPLDLIKQCSASVSSKYLTPAAPILCSTKPLFFSYEWLSSKVSVLFVNYFLVLTFIFYIYLSVFPYPCYQFKYFLSGSEITSPGKWEIDIHWHR